VRVGGYQPDDLIIGRVGWAGSTAATPRTSFLSAASSPCCRRPRRRPTTAGTPARRVRRCQRPARAWSAARSGRRRAGGLAAGHRRPIVRRRCRPGAALAQTRRRVGSRRRGHCSTCSARLAPRTSRRAVDEGRALARTAGVCARRHHPRVPGHPGNLAVYHRGGGYQGGTGYPLVRVLALLACGTRTIRLVTHALRVPSRIPPGQHRNSRTRHSPQLRNAGQKLGITLAARGGWGGHPARRGLAIGQLGARRHLGATTPRMGSCHRGAVPAPAGFSSGPVHQVPKEHRP
jgi:hypothetical protein